MKKFYLIALTALTVAGTADAALKPSRVRHSDLRGNVESRLNGTTPTRRAAKKQLPDLRTLPAAEAEGWLPGSVTVESYFNGQWMQEGDIAYTYDSAGRPLTETGDGSRITYTYDENGNRTQKLTETTKDGLTYTPYERVDYGYDSVVKNFMVSVKTYYWQLNRWDRNGNNQSFEITRNADGNIAKIDRMSWAKTGNFLVSSLVIEYGADKKASSLTLSENDYNGGMEVAQVVKDIEWLATDGQILDIDNYTSVANRAAKATVSYGDDEWYNMTYSYPDSEADSYVADLQGQLTEDEYVMAITGTEKYTQLDTRSYEFETELVYSEGGMELFKTAQIQREILGMDDLIIEVYEAEIYDDVETEISAWSRGQFTYDPTDGHPVSHTLEDFYPAEDEDAYYASRADEPAGEWVPVMRVNFFDVKKTSGVNSVITDGADGEVEYFNLQGVRVANPAAGLYIRRQGGSTSKVLIK